MEQRNKIYVMPDGTVGIERRTQPRKRTFKGAVLIFNRRFSTFEGLVRNRCANGARLEFEDNHALPKRFTLALVDEDEREVEIRWRNQSSLGVAYV